MLRTIGSALVVGFIVMASGCAAPAGVVKAAEDLSVPVTAMANRYAGLVDALAVDPASKFDLLQEMKEDLDQFEKLHERLVEYLEGKGAFDANQAREYIGLLEELRDKLKERDL